jgi:prepilin-type N-terminal cleavage/methylation domain-containing protein
MSHSIRSQRGFTLIGILIVAVIICILAMGGLQFYSGAAGTNTDYKPDTVKGGINLASLKGTLSSLALFQAQEYSLRNKYIPTIEQLITQTYSVGYNAKATDRVPLVPMFDLTMTVSSSGFVIKAVPNTLAGAPRDSPTYVIDQTMRIREE